MKFTNIKRVVKEDFPKDNRVLIEKLSFVLNPALEQLTNIFNKGIDFDNLNQELITFTTELDSTGVPKTPLVIKSSLKTRVQGMQIIRADNLESDSIFPTSGPFVTFSTSAGMITVAHITGIPADHRYTITAITIG